jgi:Ala-tRNA(Pro) deacylase
MDHKLKQYLEKYNIKYQMHEHSPVFTVAQSREVTTHIPGVRTKSLFLRDENNRFYLVSMPGERRLNMKDLRMQIKVKALHFASPEQLYKELKLKPGSVSLFGMINAKNVILILDKEIWQAKESGFHPNINTETIVLDHANLEKFYDSLDCDKKILNLKNE